MVTSKIHDAAVREYLHTVNRVPELRVDGTRNFDVKLFGQPCFDGLPLNKLPELVALGAPYSPIPGENESEDEEADSASSSESDDADETEFDVEEVLDTRLNNGVLEYIS